MNVRVHVHHGRALRLQLDRRHATRSTAQIKVTPQAAQSAGTGHHRHRRHLVPAGVTTNVQVKAPGSSAFVRPRAAPPDTTLTYTYTPSAGPGAVQVPGAAPHGRSHVRLGRRRSRSTSVQGSTDGRPGSPLPGRPCRFSGRAAASRSRAPRRGASIARPSAMSVRLRPRCQSRIRSESCSRPGRAPQTISPSSACRLASDSRPESTCARSAPSGPARAWPQSSTTILSMTSVRSSATALTVP